MADFTGGSGNDSLSGTTGDDTFLNGGGRDTISGGDGNDTVTFNAPASGGSVITGGAGTDTLRIVDFPLALTQTVYSVLYPTGAPQSVVSLTNSTVNGFERIEFGGAAGGFNSIQLGFGGGLPNQMAGVTDVNGSAAYDSLVLVAFNPSATNPITVTAPTLTLTNWSTPDRPYLPADAVIVLIAGPGRGTINGTNNGGLQVLNGAAGNDTLIGSDGMDRLNGAGGINQLYGGGGDDALAVSNTLTYINGVLQAPQVTTGAGSLFDGGSGTDWMIFGGSVNFQGTVSSIEGIYFGPATGPAIIPPSGVVGVQPYTEVWMSVTTLSQFASNLELDGVGTLTIDLLDGESVDASAWTQTSGAAVNTVFELSTATTGATVVGTGWDDFVVSANGNNLITLGEGFDRFRPEGGNDTITDFTDGEDVIDLGDSDIYSYAELQSLLAATGGSIAQVGSDVVISYTSDASTPASLTLKNFSLANLDASDFIFATPSPFPLFLVGGPGDDTLNGGTANDTLDGSDGNDVLIGRGGIDSLVGGNGDDTFIFNSARTGAGFDVINGGTGTDTLLLREQAGAPQGAFGGTLSTYVFLNTNSVEKLEFDGSAGNTINSFFIRFVNGAGGVPVTLGAPTAVIGSDGIDSIGFLASGGMGTGSTITIPTVSASNWNPATKTYLAPFGDTVSLVGLNTPTQTFNYSLTANAANGAAGIVQVLSSGAGNDTMNGSSGRELLVYSGGADQLFGNDGDDALVIANTATTTFNGATPVTTTLTGAGALFNGGGGTDFLSVGGAVNFQGTLVSIEGIYLQPGYAINSAAAGSQARAQLTLSDSAFLGLGSSLQFDGVGDVIVNVASGTTFTVPTGYTFLPGSDVTLVINGAAGNEVFRIGATPVSVVGGDGNDIIELADVTPAGVSIEGGNGTDTLRVTAAAQGPNGVDLSGLFLSGLETLQLASTSGGPTLKAILDDVQLTDFTSIVGGAGTDNLVVNFTSGGLKDISGLSFSNFFGLDSVLFDGSLQSDGIELDLISHGGTWQVLGGSGDDTINGVTGVDSIDGGAGNDSLGGGAGTDTLIGGQGDDTLAGGAGTNQLTGGIGNDVYIIESVTDVISENAAEGTDEVRTALSVLNLSTTANIENITYTGAGNARLTGNDGDNLITGGAGNDTLSGGLGNDTLAGEGGSDQLYGGAGDDTYVIGSLGDAIFEGGGIDTVRTTLNTYSLGSGLENLVFIGAGNFAGTGNSAANDMTGGSGDDTLDGGLGNDTMRGGAGNDTYVIADGGDTVVEAADEGIDTIQVVADFTLGDNVENMVVGGKAATVNTGNALANNITGNVGSNRLLGLDGNDTLDGGEGNDTLDGGTGDDSLIGGLGNDVFVVDSSGDAIVEGASGGFDTVLSTAASYTLSDNIEVLISQVGTAAFAGTGSAQANRIVGGNGADTLDGGDGDDTLLGGLGNDSLVGGGGNDRFEIGTASGNDAIHGGTGTDTVVATAANVTLRLTAVSDIEAISANGFAGFRIAGTTGNETLDFSGTTLTSVISIDGGAGNDQITGSAAADNLIGNSGNDTLNGGDAADTVDGGFGNDSLVGGAGADTIIGGGGRDVMTGGSEADVFRFTAKTDSTRGATADVITDFQVGIDRIDLSGIDPSAAAGDQAYLFNGAGAFLVNGLAQVRVFTSGTNTVVQLDHDGNGTSDMEIVLNGNPPLTSADFLL